MKLAGPGWGRGPAVWALEREMIEAILGRGLSGITNEGACVLLSNEVSYRASNRLSYELALHLRLVKNTTTA